MKLALSRNSPLRRGAMSQVRDEAAQHQPGRQGDSPRGNKRAPSHAGRQRGRVLPTHCRGTHSPPGSARPAFSPLPHAPLLPFLRKQQPACCLRDPLPKALTAPRLWVADGI